MMIRRARLSIDRRSRLRGHWADRLAAIDALDDAPPLVEYSHLPLAAFDRGQPLAIELAVRSVDDGTRPISARPRYRHVNQAETYRSVEMESEAGRYRATIPGGYSDSPYPLEYFFELHQGRSPAWLFPGFAEDLANQPYFVVRQRATRRL